MASYLAAQNWFAARMFLRFLSLRPVRASASKIAQHRTVNHSKGVLRCSRYKRAPMRRSIAGATRYLQRGAGSSNGSDCNDVILNMETPCGD
jgi:hypothetical protein